MTSPRPPLVAVVNKIPTLSTCWRRGLETHGIRAVCGSLRDFRRGHDDVVEFIKRHNPIVLLCDISAPYAANWDYLEVLRLIPESGVVPFVVTTANKRALEKAVGSTDAIEITGTTEDFEAVTAAIASAHGI